MDDDLRWRILRKKTQELNLVSAVTVFRKHDIEPIAMKGWATGRFYPTGQIRHYTDIDLAVSPADFSNALELIQSGPAARFQIDLHQGLRHLDKTDWEDLFVRSTLIELNDVNIRVLCEEDHLRVVCVHWLTDGGVRARLWDIYHMVDNRKIDFDWHRCLEAAGPVRKQWVILSVCAARDYLELDVDKLPDEIRSAKIPPWMHRSLQKEWQYEERIRPLALFLRSPRQLMAELRRRLPPNPIAATVDVEGRMDDGPRIGYQIRSMFVRLGPSAKRISRRLFAFKRVN